MKGIYLAAGKAYHPNHDIVYQDISVKRDLPGDMMEVDLSPYDYIIASPPCNYWSRARGNRISTYSLKTKHLLPDIINKLVSLGKPFIVENVKNDVRMYSEGILPRNDCFVHYHGRHIYFTNILIDFSCIPQRHDFTHHGWVIKYDDMDSKYHQGGFNVHNVIEHFIDNVE